MGTYLLASNFSSGQNEAVAVLRLTNPLTAPTFTNAFVLPGDIDNQSAAFPNAPQSGGAMPIDAGVQQILNAVWRNNKLYAVTTVNPPGGTDIGQATAHWFVFNADGVLAPTLADQGNVGGEDLGAGTHTFYPSIAADDSGNFAIGFSASGPAIFPGAYYTIHTTGDPAGTVQATGTLAAGLASYVRTFGGADNRWGDYSGTSIDPDGSFWFFNEYADTPGSGSAPDDGRWRTRWGHLTFDATVPTTPGVPDLVAASDLGFSDTDNITSDTTPTFTGTGTDGMTVVLREGPTPIGSALVAGGVWTITVASPLGDGGHSITAEQTNGLNTSPPSAPLFITIDTTHPTLFNSGPTLNILLAAHRLIYTFSEDVGGSLTTADLVMTQQPSGTVIATNLAYDSGTRTATFTFPGFASGTLPDGRFTATLSGSGVFDVAGNTLGADNVANNIYFLRGDANRDGIVNLGDFNILASNFGFAPRNFLQGDFNYDTVVGLGDFNILASRFGTSVAPETFSATRVTTTTTTGPGAKQEQQRLVNSLREDLLA
jgi:hypothetical protein